MKLRRRRARPSLTSIGVQGLLGDYSHTIPLDPDGITIVFGPNGVGKTKLFQLVAAVGALDNLTIAATQFDELMLDFDNGHRLVVTRPTNSVNEPDDTDEPEPTVTWVLLDESETEVARHNVQSEDFRMERETLRRIAVELPFLERVDANTWLDERSGAVMSRAEVLRVFGDAVYTPARRNIDRAPDVLARFVASLRISMIDTQRLVGIPRGTDRNLARRTRERGIRNESAIELYAAEFRDLIEAALADYARVSASGDRTFVPRALEAAKKTVRDDEIREAYERTNALSERAMAAGLLDAQSPVELPSKTTPTIRRILDLHFTDMLARLNTLVPLLERIETFQELLEGRLIKKEVTVERQRGFFVSRTDADGTQILRPESLSSGEQHLLVMLYRLIFGTADGSLVLIDEPEISLNSAWQLRFIDDLERISAITGEKYLLATHSAQIIAGRDDLMRELRPG